MADNLMYFGTQEYMRWIKCPNSGMGRNRVGWGANGTYLNGGGWSRTSGTKHFEPSLTWSFLNHQEVREIEDYYLGAYGEGPVYWLDAFAMGTNVLPAHWSIPRMAADDAPPLVVGRRPTLSDTTPNNLSLPSKTATYELRAGDTFDRLFIPVPDGFVAHVAAWGTSTGTASLYVESADPGDVTLTDASVSTPTWTSFTASGYGITLTAAGVGFLSLAGLVVQVLPAGEVTQVIPGLLTSLGLSASPSLVPSDTITIVSGVGVPEAPRFLSGAGHSGCVFKSAPTVVGYSAPSAIDYQSVTAEFIEVGSWLR